MFFKLSAWGEGLTITGIPQASKSDKPSRVYYVIQHTLSLLIDFLQIMSLEETDISLTPQSSSALNRESLMADALRSHVESYSKMKLL